VSTDNLRIFFLVGPTAVGKTAIAAEVAAACNCEIVSADAFQVYQGMDILTAKPSPEILQRVPHHLIGNVPLSESFDVGKFQSAAFEAISEIYARGKFPLVAGGTGLYVRALTHGLADLPKADLTVRSELETLTLGQLQMRYETLDPIGAKQVDANNPRRLIRAIEVCILTGKPFSSFKEEWSRKPENIGGFMLHRERPDLYDRINLRTREMLNAGLLEEVNQLGITSPTASQVIGLREARECLAGEITQEEAISRIQQATRHYSKRQMTWFQRESLFTPVSAETNSAIQTIIRETGNFFR
jgi:tRNA dimethylallyltransferase